MGLVGTGELIELASGVDSFYLSGRGTLGAALVEDLNEARASARETRTRSPFDVGVDRFWVAGGGLNRYQYRLEHPRGLLGLTTSASLPTVHIQPAAAFIHAVGIVAALKWFTGVAELLLGQVSWKASRVDLFMDSHGWGIESADRANFVCRAKQRVVYEDEDTLRTLAFGTRSAGVMARIYDKTEESRKKGTDWWPSVWGDAFVTGERVVRVEFQVGRPVLRQAQIDTPGESCAPSIRRPTTARWTRTRSLRSSTTRPERCRSSTLVRTKSCTRCRRIARALGL